MSASNPKGEKKSEVLAAVPEAFIGAIAGVEGGVVLVDFNDNPAGVAIAARCTIDVSNADLGSEVTLVFINGDPSQPVITGLLRALGEAVGHQTIQVDGEEVTVRGDKRVVLKCGKASITLTEDGKILIRGSYVLAHSSGVAQLQGGVIRLN